jgi:pyruvate formate lyase activating enzyme
MTRVATRYVTHRSDGRVQCDVCPRECSLDRGQRGLCFVRMRDGDDIVLDTYGRSSGFCLDPIEKKPLHHFYPGSSVLSFGTAGCNLTCKFCQNWDISKSRDVDTLASDASPETIALAARSAGARSVAFTYNDPVIFIEYAMDTADACHAHDIKTVAVTAGYIKPVARRDFFAKIDAANVDLKAFTEGFYRSLCGASLDAVKDTLVYLARETKVWLELTTLVIPGHNDDERELRALASWVREALGAHVPLHFSAFHPDYKLRDVARTPPETLRRAREIAREEGLSHVYVGNVHDREGDTTFCARCGHAVIERDWYELIRYRLDDEGRCPACASPVEGAFDRSAGNFGRRRLPLRLR